MKTGANFSSGSKNESPSSTAIIGPKSCSGPYLEPSLRFFSSGILYNTINGIDSNNKETQRGVSNINNSEKSPRYGKLSNIDHRIELSELLFPNMVA